LLLALAFGLVIEVSSNLANLVRRLFSPIESSTLAST